jgi:hypothetical protein
MVLSQAVYLFCHFTHTQTHTHTHPQDYVTLLHALAHVTQVTSAVAFQPSRTVITLTDVTVELPKKKCVLYV